MSLFVVGAGAIGTYLAVHLDATCLVRDASVAASLPGTFRLEGAGAAERQVRVAVLDEKPLPADAIVVVTAKVGDLEDVVSRLARVAPGATVVLVQNGIGVVEHVGRWVGNLALARGACWMGVRSVARGHAVVAGVHSFVVAAVSEGARAGVATLVAASVAAGVPATAAPDARRLEWQKALWNLAVNGVATLADRENGVVLDRPEVRALAERLIDESFAVARAEGIDLGPPDRDRVFASLAVTRANVNASLQDVRAGRPTEMPFLNAAVRDLAARHGIDVPVTRAVAALVEALEEGRARH